MHPKNGLKPTTTPATGGLYQEDAANALDTAEVRVYADGYTPPAPAQTLAALNEEPGVPEPTRMQRMERQAGRIGEHAPWVLMLCGFVLGCVAARLLRRD